MNIQATIESTPGKIVGKVFLALVIVERNRTGCHMAMG